MGEKFSYQGSSRVQQDRLLAMACISGFVPRGCRGFEGGWEFPCPWHEGCPVQIWTRTIVRVGGWTRGHYDGVMRRFAIRQGCLSVAGREQQTLHPLWGKSAGASLAFRNPAFAQGVPRDQLDLSGSEVIHQKGFGRSAKCPGVQTTVGKCPDRRGWCVLFE
jgi:hypothetical protein